MKTNLPATIRLGVLLGTLGVATVLAYESGGFAYTKRITTNVLREPRPLAPLAGTLGLRR
jgi:hypothetical protein